MSEVKKNFYQEIAEKNEGIEPSSVRSLFIWFDLFSFALSFQLLYIAAYSLGMSFSITFFSILFIFITDSLVKINLRQDSKNFEKLKSQLALVKLWTIPLMALGICTMAALIVVTFGLI